MKPWLSGLLLMLAACAPEVQDFNPRTSPPDAKMAPYSLQAGDGAALPARSWIPEGKPKAVVIAVHGFNDYSNAFERPGAVLKSHGIAVYAYDQRGFGKTPRTGIWPGPKNLVSDLAEAVKQVRNRYPGTPVYLLGESMGGAVVVVALADPDFPAVDGAILSAPALWGDETLNPLYRFVLWASVHTMPSQRFTGSQLKIIASNNYPMLRRLSADPFVIKGTRVDAVYGLVHLMDRAYDDVPNVKVPVLLLYGGQDQVIPRDPIERSVPRFTAPLQYLYYPDSYHMLMRDIQGASVAQDIAAWIEHPDRPVASEGAELNPSLPVPKE